MKKKYDLIISIGEDFQCCKYLKRKKLQYESYPFDFITNDESVNNCLETRLNLILNNFKFFFEIADFKYFPEIFTGISGDDDKEYGFYRQYLNNNFSKKVFLRHREKYLHKIKCLEKKLIKNENNLLVWFSSQTDTDIIDRNIIEYSKKINSKFKKNIDIVIFKNNKNYPDKSKFDTINLSNCVTKYILNMPSYYGTEPEAKDNFKLLDSIFQRYSLKRKRLSFKIFTIKRLTNLITFFIPNQRLRGLIRNKITINYFKKIWEGKFFEIIESLPFIPKIENGSKTIKQMLNKKSICRFADGEEEIIKGNGIPFQRRSEKLSSRLKEILLSNDENIMISVSLCYPDPKYLLSEDIQLFTFMNQNIREDNIRRSINYLQKDQIYYQAFFSLYYILYFKVENDDFFKNHYNTLKNIWREKEIVIICGESVFDNISYNIFDCSKNIEFIWTKSKNAFDGYENLLSQAKKINLNKIVIIILGPTATVLAYDLAKLGYQALDLGHLAKDYDWYRKKKKIR